MRKGTFQHAENPRGAPPPQHNPKALNALSALAKRGGHNVHAENLQRPMPQRQQLPQGSLPAQALGAAQQPQMPQGMPPQGMQGQGMPLPQQAPPQVEMQPEMRAAPPPQIEQDVPPDYYAKMLEDMVKNDPSTKKGQKDWRHDFLDKSKRIRTTINRIRELADKL